MKNFLLACFMVGAAVVWRRSGYWLPRALPIPLRTRQLALLVSGCAVLVLVGGFSVGDIISGRTQVAVNPVRYATRLTGAEAHHHDIFDTGVFWRQVTLQFAGAILVGGSLLALGRAPIVRTQRS